MHRAFLVVEAMSVGVPITIPIAVRTELMGRAGRVELRGREMRGWGAAAVGYDAWWAAQVRDGVRYPHPFAECDDADFGFEKVDVQVEQDVARDLLLDEPLHDTLVETFRPQPFNHFLHGPFRGVGR